VSIPSVLALENVSRTYPSGVTALRDASLAIARSESIALCGPSGCGKSTLLHVLCGLDRPTSGRVLIDGMAPATGGEWARIRARRIGFVFQAFHLLPTLSAIENVQVPMIGVERKARVRFRRAEALLDRVGLSSRADHRPAELSGGECQRVAIARSLANGPDVILADEPTGNLDPETAEGIMEFLAELNGEGRTIVMVTHDLRLAGRAKRALRLVNGRIQANGEVRSFAATPASSCCG